IWVLHHPYPTNLPQARSNRRSTSLVTGFSAPKNTRFLVRRQGKTSHSAKLLRLVNELAL
ncbi:hypothetical protein SERLA73DRAFT_134573, partial [Serpula lacrymans var. lacrymans S7.3]